MFGVTAQQKIAASAVKVTNSRPLLSSHTFSVWSPEPEITWQPSGVTATALTPTLWPASVRNSGPRRGQRLLQAAYPGRGGGLAGLLIQELQARFRRR